MQKNDIAYYFVERLRLNSTNFNDCAWMRFVRRFVLRLWRSVRVNLSVIWYDLYRATQNHEIFRPSVGFWSWSRFLAVSLQVTWVICPVVGCRYFPSGPQLPSQPLRGLLPIWLVGEQRHDGYASHSATEPPFYILTSREQIRNFLVWFFPWIRVPTLLKSAHIWLKVTFWTTYALSKSKLPYENQL